MSGVSNLRYSDPALTSQLQAIQAGVSGNDSDISTLLANLNALTAQVGALAPENVIENGEFTAQAIKDLLVTVDGEGSGLDADLLAGHQWSEIQTLIDGQALGVGQTWQDVTAARLAGVTYTNSTNRTICVMVRARDMADPGWFNLEVDGVFMNPIGGTGEQSSIQTLIVPPGSDYKLVVIGSVDSVSWLELR